MRRAAIVALVSVALVGLSWAPAGAADECSGPVNICPSLSLIGPIGPVPVGPFGPFQVGPFVFCIPLPGGPSCPK